MSRPKCREPKAGDIVRLPKQYASRYGLIRIGPIPRCDAMEYWIGIADRDPDTGMQYTWLFEGDFQVVRRAKGGS